MLHGKTAQLLIERGAEILHKGYKESHIFINRTWCRNSAKRIQRISHLFIMLQRGAAQQAKARRNLNGVCK